MIEMTRSERREKARRLAARKRNEAFEGMTSAQKRVAVAKDVLQWLKFGVLRAKKGVYFEDDKKYDDQTANKLAHEQIPEQSCTVCAIGACYVASVVRKNKITMDEVRGALDGSMVDYMRGIFPSKMLRDMEEAFESLLSAKDVARGGYEEEVYNYATDKMQKTGRLIKYRKALLFGARVGKNAEARMRAIMQNVIDNGGSFRP